MVPETEVGALETKLNKGLNKDVDALCPSILVTTTAVAPAVPGGAVTTKLVEPVREVTVALTPPIVTRAWAPVVEKPVPVIVTEEPDISPIDDGDICEMVGGLTIPVGVVNERVDP